VRGEASKGKGEEERRAHYSSIKAPLRPGNPQFSSPPSVRYTFPPPRQKRLVVAAAPFAEEISPPPPRSSRSQAANGRQDSQADFYDSGALVVGAKWKEKVRPSEVACSSLFSSFPDSPPERNVSAPSPSPILAPFLTSRP